MDFEADSGSGPDLFPGLTWEQLPPNRWKRSKDQVIEGEYSLQHAFDNPESGCDYLIVNHLALGDSFGVSPGGEDSLVFSFRIRHGYAPSASNNWQLALLAQFQEEPLQIQKGIVVGVNFRGSDDLVRIWQCEEGIPAERLATQLNYQEDVGTGAAPMFRLVCHPEGWLSLYYVRDPAEGKLQQLGSCLLEQIPDGRQLVIRHEYSSARDRKLWLDELLLEGPFRVDSLPPAVTEMKVLGKKTLRIRFSEAIRNPAEESFLLRDRQPEKVWREGKDVLLEFSIPFPNREVLKLNIRDVCDVDQNCLADTLVAFMRNEAVWGDVVFNEIMADPDPAIRLPREEYLELYNRSDYPLDLENWRLDILSRSYFLSSRQLLPFDFVVLKDLTLPNEGALLALYNGQGHLIHGVRYRVPWDAPEWKKEGGWALESPDPHHPCLISSRWAYSEDPSGGTPGRENSQDAPGMDQEPPLMLYYGYGEKGEVILYYSEPLRPANMDREDFMIRPGNVMAGEVALSSPLSSEVVLSFPEDLQDRRQFNMELPVLTDCQGNASRKGMLRGGKIQAPACGSLLVNEIMYHPLEGFPEYVELYNPGPGYCDLLDFSFHVVGPGETPDRPHPLCSRSRICLPDQFLVLTSCVPWLEETYGLDRSGSWVEVEDLPLLKDSGGTLWLTDRAGSVVDQVTYSEEMHMDLLSDTRGISLERMSADRPGNEPGNWHSAASIAGYATPGRKNSQATNPDPGAELLEVAPSVFSPDNDGFEDVLKIHLSPGAKGWVLSLWISDLSGVLVRQLANNHLAAPSQSYSWDGEGEDGSMQAMGFYLVLARGYHPPSGQRWIRRKVVGLVYR